MNELFWPEDFRYGQSDYIKGKGIHKLPKVDIIFIVKQAPTKHRINSI